MSMYGIFNLVVFAALLSFLFQLAKKSWACLAEC